VKTNLANTKYWAIALSSVAAAAALIIWWMVFYRSSGAVLAAAHPNSNAVVLHKANKEVPAKEAHSIVTQSPGVVFRQDGGAKETQTMGANCAKGYVRRGSMCEFGSPAASNLTAQRSIRPPERE
jgi:hypothetical protein